MTDGKLVRDKIPKIIEAQGRKANTLILDETGYQNALVQKLFEETSEYSESRSLEELADILEVVLTLARVHGATPETLEEVRHKKWEDRGGFSQRIFLRASS